ncbi:MAG TPA: TetR/AcrR family transcriptional regulator [Dongiaceae bacterium]|nr:TetR/AcrR family transcriptional regulator [Dongiaceae bacterium]
MKHAVEDITLFDDKADTREKLILVAIRMFAEQGFAGVSMRTINSAAGTRNSSAVHYHFGNKSGIIQAIFDKLESQLRPLFDRLVLELQQRHQEGKLQVDDVVMAVQLPFWLLYNTPGYGRHAVKLVARLIQEADTEMQDLYNGYIKEPAAGLYTLLRGLLPEKREQHLKFQLVHCLMATISGMATMDQLPRTPLGDIRFEQELELLLTYVQFVSRGMSCQSHDVSLDMSFWGRYAEYLMPTPVSAAT